MSLEFARGVLPEGRRLGPVIAFLFILLSIAFAALADAGVLP